jgi:hypothetical protein
MRDARARADLPAAAGPAAITPPASAATTTTTESAAAAAAARAPTTTRRGTPARRRIEPHDVLGRRAFLTLDHVELHTLALCQRPEPTALDRAVMHEYIITAVPCDETESLVRIEPLYRSALFRHVDPIGRFITGRPLWSPN